MHACVETSLGKKIQFFPEKASAGTAPEDTNAVLQGRIRERERERERKREREKERVDGEPMGEERILQGEEVEARAKGKVEEESVEMERMIGLKGTERERD
eukprot:1365856-Amorphochlora_amoeboformis.AAC.2